ncbi:MAG: hypothetical protein IPJ04_17620 [Candidatus Eisenbacteria bacterium]|nr:hypothetical protein [Candidatus Eisenbacteria bacterium]
MIRRLLALLLLCCLSVPAAHASSVVPVTVKLSGYTQPAKVGVPISVDIVIGSGQTLMLQSFSVAPTGGATGFTHNAPATPYLITARGTRVIRVSFTPTTESAGIRISFNAGTDRITRTFDLSAEQYGRLTTPGSVLSLPGEIVTAPVSAAIAAADPGLQPVSRESRAGTLKPVRVASPDHAGSVQTTVLVKGRFLYTRDDGQNIPVMGATVRVYDEDWDFDELMATTTTDADGRFSVSGSEDESGPDIYVEIEMANSRVVVEDDNLEFNYIFRTNVKDDFGGSTADFGTFSPNGNLGNSICHVFTNVYRAARYVASYGWNTPQVDVQYPSSDWPNYDGSEIHIPTVVGGRDYGWQSGTHMHEFGHHVQHSFFHVPDHDYDNGICNNANGDPGHCAFCQEDGGTAINEGFANFLADRVGRTFESEYGLAVRNGRWVESLGECTDTNGNPCACDPYLTEGFFGALLVDLTDGGLEDDPRGGFGSDKLTLGFNPVMDAMDLANANGPSGFINDFIARHPELDRSALWNTMSNAGYELDTNVPGISPYFQSTSHNAGLAFSPSLDRTIDMTWQPATDDWSGAKRYSLLIAASPSIPNTSVEADSGRFSFTVTAPGPGTWYVMLRAQDATGKWSNSYATAGPYRIRDPEPGDLLFPLIQPSGWESPIVLRSDNTATSGATATSSSLDGGGASYWNTAYMNAGELSVAAGYIRFLVDGRQLDSLATSSVAAGATRKYNNQGPFAVLGGRHTAEVWLDAQENHAEDSETNNHLARQFVFEPDNLTVNVQRVGVGAPVRDAGHEFLGITAPTAYDNCDGFQFSNVYTSGQFQVSAPWAAVYGFATTAFADVDLKVFDNTFGSFSGFAAPMRTSARGDGELDAVFANKAPNNNTVWNVGVVNADGGPAAYKLRHIVSSNINVGDSVTVSLATDQMMKLFHFVVGTGETGKYSLIVTGAPALNGGNVSTVWLDDDLETASLSTYSAKVTSGFTGSSAMVVSALEAGTYAIALYRNPEGGTGPIDFQFRIEPAAPEPTPSQPLGWNAPLVPRATNDASAVSVQPGAILNGDAVATWMNLAVTNEGELVAPLLGTRIRHASTSVGGPTFLSVPAGGTVTSRNAFSAVVPAGRRVLWVDVDPDDNIVETNEDDNRFGRSWVWTPPVASFDTPIWRGAAPRVDAGWSTLPEDDPLHNNQDGIRVPVLSNHAVTQWAGVALMPRQDDDVDLWLHEVATSPTEGFDDPIGTSAWGPSELDYMVVDVSSTARRGFDLGIVRATESDPLNFRQPDTTSYLTNIVGDLSHATSIGTFGAYTVAAHRLMQVHTFPLAFGRYTIRLVNTSGTVNWGLAVHEPGKPFQNRTLARKRAGWLAGNGASEEVAFNVSNPGNYAVVVFKTGSGDVVKSGSYRLEISTTTTDTEAGAPPVRTRIVSATPSPFRTDVRLGFDLAQGTEVTLEVLDVTGARRRVLAHGSYAAGRQNISWDGRDDSGNRLPPGLYLVRMLAGGTVSTLKVIRMQ